MPDGIHGGTGVFLSSFYHDRLLERFDAFFFFPDKDGQKRPITEARQFFQRAAAFMRWCLIDLVRRSIGRKSYALTDKSLSALRAAGVPEAIWSKIDSFRMRTVKIKETGRERIEDKRFPTQEKLWEELGGVLSQGELSKYRTLIWQSIDSVHRKQVDSHSSGDSISPVEFDAVQACETSPPDDILQEVEIANSLHRAVEGLDGKYREIVDLHFFCGKKFVEIDEILGLKPNQARTRWLQAQLILQEQLGDLL